MRKKGIEETLDSMGISDPKVKEVVKKAIQSGDIHNVKRVTQELYDTLSKKE